MRLRDRLLPWSALLLGGLGWAVSSQWGAMRVSDACIEARPWQTVIVGLGGFLLAVLGAMLSRRGLGGPEVPTARFARRLSLAADLVFALAIVFHTAATLLIPRCFA